MNIIQAKHINNFGDTSGEAYTYKLPDGVRIGAGQYILVENRKTGRNEIVKTVTDSEDVNGNTPKMVMGEKRVISNVLGEYLFFPFAAGDITGGNDEGSK